MSGIKKVELTNGSDGKIPVNLTTNGKIEPLNLNLPGGDFIKFLIPGKTETIVKILDQATSGEVVVDSDPCGQFHAVIESTDDLKEGIQQDFVVEAKLGTRDILKNFSKVLDIDGPTLAEPAP